MSIMAEPVVGRPIHVIAFHGRSDKVLCHSLPHALCQLNNNFPDFDELAIHQGTAFRSRLLGLCGLYFCKKAVYWL